MCGVVCGVVRERERERETCTYLCGMYVVGPLRNNRAANRPPQHTHTHTRGHTDTHNTHHTTHNTHHTTHNTPNTTQPTPPHIATLLSPVLCDRSRGGASESMPPLTAPLPDTVCTCLISCFKAYVGVYIGCLEGVCGVFRGGVLGLYMVYIHV